MEEGAHEGKTAQGSQSHSVALGPVACPNLFRFMKSVPAMHSRIFATYDSIISVLQMRTLKPEGKLGERVVALTASEVLIQCSLH